MPTRLSDCLVAAGLASTDAVRAAIARQAVYGGALDTALLELGTLDEADLWSALGQATGLPLPEPALYQTPAKGESVGAASALDGAWSERCRAVPVGVKEGAIQVLCGEPVAVRELEAASAAIEVQFVLYVVPEVRLAAVRQIVFDRPMPPRLVRLFARVAGTQPVRRWQAAHAKPVRPDSPEGVELLDRRPAAAEPVLPPAAAKPPAAKPPAAKPPAAKPPVAPAKPPTPAPTARTIDKREVAALIARLDGKGGESDRAAAHAALISISKQDHGPRPRRWEAWWKKHQDEDPVEWLFEGLSHKTTEIRASAEEELRALTGEYFGYHFDLSRAEREDARARWQAWWRETRPKRKS